MRSADVVIIGGGIVGFSGADHPTQGGGREGGGVGRGGQQGRGSTGKRMGGGGGQSLAPGNIRMSLYSIPFFRSFDEAMGHPSGYRAQGYLFVATHERHLEYLRANHVLQVSMGLKTVERLTSEDVIRMVPQLRSDDILGGSF